MKQHQISLGNALAQLPAPDGKRFAELFSRGDLVLEIYAPHGVDPQTPHSRDEIYIVASGSGRFFNGESVVDVSSGDFLFVAARVEHRFSDFSEDFAVWVIFFGEERQG